MKSKASDCCSGFFRGDALLGTAQVKLQPLETKCVLHDSFDVSVSRDGDRGRRRPRVTGFCLAVAGRSQARGRQSGGEAASAEPHRRQAGGAAAGEVAGRRRSRGSRQGLTSSWLPRGHPRRPRTYVSSGSRRRWLRQSSFSIALGPENFSYYYYYCDCLHS